ncbi:MAG: hypothetical protein Q4F07_00435, partial [Bacteroidales bacterium]|nr:hypothetical protein [Bacteroidales bacterium]
DNLKTPTPKPEAAEQPQPFTITVVNTDDNNKQLWEKTIKGNTGTENKYDANVGTYITISTTPTQKVICGFKGIRHKKGSYTVKMEKNKSVRFTINKDKITIRPVENETFKTDI